MAIDTSLAHLDRDVARACAAWRAWRARLERDPEAAKGEAPLDAFRDVAGKNAYDALTAFNPVAVEEPWRDALLFWVHALTQRRVTCDLDIAWALAASDPSPHEAAAPDRPRGPSWGEAWRKAITARDHVQTTTYLDAAATRGPALSSIARRQAERRVEVAHRLGLAHPFALATKMTHAELRSAATTLLARTDDLATFVRREARSPVAHASEGLRLALIPDAPEGWPAHLTLRWLEDLFGDLAKGLSLDVAVPEALGGASFARALGAFGKALRVGGVARSLPFALANDPYAIDAHRFAFVFASLPASQAFQQRALGNVARIARAQARAFARGALFEARAVAVRALLCDELDFPKPPAFEGLTTMLFGAPLPRGLAGAWPTARGDEWARLLAVLTSLPFSQDLVDRFDVDWFANPRAFQHLRARASMPALLASDSAPIDASTTAAALQARLEDALG